MLAALISAWGAGSYQLPQQQEAALPGEGLRQAYEYGEPARLGPRLPMCDPAIVAYRTHAVRCGMGGGGKLAVLTAAALDLAGFGECEGDVD